MLSFCAEHGRFHYLAQGPAGGSKTLFSLILAMAWSAPTEAVVKRLRPRPKQKERMPYVDIRSGFTAGGDGEAGVATSLGWKARRAAPGAGGNAGA